MADAAPPTTALSWRVPVENLATARVQIWRAGIAGVFAVFGSMMLAPESLRFWLAGGLALVAGLVVLVLLVRYGLLWPQPNVAINRNQAAWVDSLGRSYELQLSEATAFRIEPSEAEPATLVFRRRDDFDSLPIPIYPPATPAQVRSFLTVATKLRENAPTADCFAEQLHLHLQHQAAASMHEDGRGWLAFACALIPPQQDGDNRWLALQLGGLGATYDADANLWRVSETGKTAELPSAAAVAERLKQHLAPPDNQFRQRLARELEGKIDWSEKRLAELLDLAEETVKPLIDGRIQSLDAEIPSPSADAASAVVEIQDRTRRWHVAIDVAWRDGAVHWYMQPFPGPRRQRDELLGADARRLGCYYEMDEEARTFELVGSREGLLRFCGRLREASSRLQAVPEGAQPPQVRLGGANFGLNLHWAPHQAVLIEALAGSADDLAQLADQLQTQAGGLSPGQASDDLFWGDPAWTLTVRCEADNFDPADACTLPV